VSVRKYTQAAVKIQTKYRAYRDRTRNVSNEAQDPDPDATSGLKSSLHHHHHHHHHFHHYYHNGAKKNDKRIADAKRRYELDHCTGRSLSQLQHSRTLIQRMTREDGSQSVHMTEPGSVVNVHQK
jgi:hypothetical protein